MKTEFKIKDKKATIIATTLRDILNTEVYKIREDVRTYVNRAYEQELTNLRVLIDRYDNLRELERNRRRTWFKKEIDYSKEIFNTINRIKLELKELGLDHLTSNYFYYFDIKKELISRVLDSRLNELRVNSHVNVSTIKGVLMTLDFENMDFVAIENKVRELLWNK